MLSQVWSGTAVELEVYSRMWQVRQVFTGKFRETDQLDAEIGELLREHLGRWWAALGTRLRRSFVTQETQQRRPRI